MKEEFIEFDPSITDKRTFYSTFLSNYNPPVQAINHFASIPWTNKWLSNPAYKIIPFWSRHVKTSGEDTFFGNTINTTETVPHFIMIQLKDFITPEPSDASSGTKLASDANAHNNNPPINRGPAELIFLLQFGERGVDGHPGVIHGGVICALLDETMSAVISQHLDNATPKPRGQIFTANLNTSFRAPVTTPAAVILKCWLVRRDKRKWLTKGQIEDESGRVLAEANAIWVLVPENKI
ncbi:hypothetical protein LTR84_011293 [Exophiala bonariae]|uniref:Thioesterase domain-containing protein n=1 Tax=Exophiala bonariae TaxID=1690606 RepID=A0AAV9MSJ2_9EURO|nr:hypothetical protein LTR84_011293 [Exophiala bonariae]